MAPAARSRATGVASAAGRKAARPLVPPVEITPAVSNESLIVMGTPCNGPRSVPRDSSASALRASSRAASPVSWTTALSWGFTASIRWRYASTTSSAETCLRRMASASEVTDAWVISPSWTGPGPGAEHPANRTALPPARSRNSRRDSSSKPCELSMGPSPLPISRFYPNRPEKIKNPRQTALKVAVIPLRRHHRDPCSPGHRRVHRVTTLCPMKRQAW